MAFPGLRYKRDCHRCRNLFEDGLGYRKCTEKRMAGMLIPWPNPCPYLDEKWELTYGVKVTKKRKSD